MDLKNMTTQELLTLRTQTSREIKQRTEGLKKEQKNTITSHPLFSQLVEWGMKYMPNQTVTKHFIVEFDQVIDMTLYPEVDFYVDAEGDYSLKNGTINGKRTKAEHEDDLSTEIDEALLTEYDELIKEISDKAENEVGDLREVIEQIAEDLEVTEDEVWEKVTETVEELTHA